MFLHHYEISPFSEKIRLMFGYCNMSWRSVICPSIPPRPGLDPLTGGYRKIPVAQDGADIFCDTRIISSEIANLQNKPLLAKENCDREANDFIDRVDLELFLAAAACISPLQSLRTLLKTNSAIQTARFIQDRVTMMSGSPITAPTARRAKQYLSGHYRELESRLSDSKFLFEEEPCVADFSAYHALWMMHAFGTAPYPKRCTAIDRWYGAMTAFGHGQSQKASSDAAFSAAKQATPRPLPATNVKDSNLGRDVAIQPADYGREQVVGTLLSSTKERWIVARQTHELGTLHVHFPKEGFAIKRI